MYNFTVLTSSAGHTVAASTARQEPVESPSLLLTPSTVVPLQIKDAFGLPLQASSNAWWSVDLDAAFVGPSVRQVRCCSCIGWIRQRRADRCGVLECQYVGSHNDLAALFGSVGSTLHAALRAASAHGRKPPQSARWQWQLRAHLHPAH